MRNPVGGVSRARRAWTRGGRGAALIEFALVFPVLLILIVSIIDFGIYLFTQHTLQFATREGVRLALVGRTLTDDTGHVLTREASVIRAIQKNAAIAMDPSRVEISLYPVNPDMSDPPNWSGTQEAGAPGAYMRVRTRYEYRPITPMLVSLGHFYVRAQATYRNEQF